MWGPASLAATQGVSAFQGFLPKFTEIRRANAENDPGFVADVRMGEVAACTLTLGIGAIASSLNGSSVPAIVALVMCTILVCLYEYTLRANDPMNPRKVV